MIDIRLNPLASVVSASPLRQHTASLRSHLSHCQAIGAFGLRFRCLAEALHSALAPRIFTTVSVTCTVLAGLLMVTGHWA